jgi:hypothetical protein
MTGYKIIILEKVGGSIEKREFTHSILTLSGGYIMVTEFMTDGDATTVFNLSSVTKYKQYKNII